MSYNKLDIIEYVFVSLPTIAVLLTNCPVFMESSEQTQSTSLLSTCNIKLSSTICTAHYMKLVNVRECNLLKWVIVKPLIVNTPDE